MYFAYFTHTREPARRLRWLTTALLLWTSAAVAQTRVLYGNDFEQQNLAAEINCGETLDWRGINQLYGDEHFSFEQTFSVEAVHIHNPADLYNDPSDDHGDYAIGMLSTREDDQLALTFDAEGATYLNLGLDLSSIDVKGCGGPFGVETPVLKISLLDTPSGEFSFDDSYPVLQEETVTGQQAPDEWTFAWTSHVVALDASAADNGRVTVLFDLVQSGYAVFDNLTITSSTEPGIVDQDLDGSADDTDSHPTDRDRCGDHNGDGQDDCDPALLPADATYDERLRQTGQLSTLDMVADSGGTSRDPDTALAGSPSFATAGVAATGADRMHGSDEDTVIDEKTGCRCTALGARPGTASRLWWPPLLAALLTLRLRWSRRNQNRPRREP